MVLDQQRVLETYDQQVLDSIISALKTLDHMKFFDFLVAENNRSFTDSFQDEDVESLAKKLIENRNENRVILGFKSMILTLERQLQDAQES